MADQINPILERAREHFKGLETREIEVPEWGDSETEPLMIHATPVTLHERRRLTALNKGDDFGQMVDLVIMKACDPEGNQLFSKMDKQALLREVDGEVIGRVAAEILGADPADADAGGPGKN